jgi:hypothetical protein
MNKVLGFFVFFLALNFSHQAFAQDKDYDPEARLVELGITLPTPPSPVANYVNGVRTGNLIFLAGKGPKYPDGHELHGKLGAEVSIEQGYDGARMTSLPRGQSVEIEMIVEVRD